MIIKNIAVVSVWAPDVPKTAQFYKDVLELEMMPIPHGGRPHFRVGESIFTILQGEPQPAQNRVPDRFPVLAFGVDDLQPMVEKLEQAGVELPWGIEKDRWSHWVMLHDPAGNLIEIAEIHLIE